MRNVHKNAPVLFEPYDWKIVENNYSSETNRNNETIFSIGNGYLGVRGFFEEGYYGEDLNQSENATMINGIYEYYDYNHIFPRPGFPLKHHSITNQANPFALKVFIDGERVHLCYEQVSEYNRTLNMQDGTMNRKFKFTTQRNKDVFLEFERFASLESKELLHMNVKVTADTPCKLEFLAELSGLPQDRCSKDCTIFECDEAKSFKDNMYVKYHTKRSQFSILAMFHDELKETRYQKIEKLSDDKVTHIYKFDMEEGQTVTYERNIAYCTSVNSTNLKEDAERIIEVANKKSYDEHKKTNAKLWKEFWESANIEIEGDTLVQQGVRYAIFSLNQSCGKDGITNISANGLTGTGYEGLTFWDTEIFMFPLFLYTKPEIARKLLVYRYSILPKARERAKELSGEGAFYSWMSINGEECTHMIECAPGQIHINPDIAYAIKQYVDTTNDYDFIEQYGAEMLLEMSKFMAYRGSFSKYNDNKFGYHVVCGPDEYSPNVNNNTYTNWLTRKQLYFTLDIIKYLEKNNLKKLKDLMIKCNVSIDDFAKWKNIADNMYIGYNEELGIYLQDDQFLERDPIDIDNIPKEKLPLLFNMHPLDLWRYQVIKQADLVLLLYLCSSEFTKEEKKRNFDFYEPRTIHDSSLSAGIHSIVACDIGYKDEAYNYLKQASRMDLDNINRNTYFGVHSACMGNTYQILINGFAGMRYDNGELHFNPFIPKNWTKLSFKIQFQNRLIQVTISEESEQFKLISGENITIYNKNKPVELKKV